MPTETPHETPDRRQLFGRRASDLKAHLRASGWLGSQALATPRYPTQRIVYGRRNGDARIRPAAAYCPRVPKSRKTFSCRRGPLGRRGVQFGAQLLSGHRAVGHGHPAALEIGNDINRDPLDRNTELGGEGFVTVDPVPDALIADRFSRESRQSSCHLGIGPGQTDGTFDRFHASKRTTGVVCNQPQLFATESLPSHSAPMNMGGRVKYARKQAGMTQAQLSARSGVSQAAISALEKRDSAWSKSLVELSRALSVTEAWLARGDGDMTAHRPAQTAPSAPAPRGRTTAHINPDILEGILESIRLQRARHKDPELSSAALAGMIVDAYRRAVTRIEANKHAELMGIISQEVEIGYNAPPDNPSNH